MGATVPAKYDLSSHILMVGASAAASSATVTPSSNSCRRGVHPAPDRGQVAGGSLVHELLGREVAHRGQRSVDGEQDLPHRDRRRRAGQARTAAGASVGVDDPGTTQLGEDVLEEVLRDVLRGGDLPRR